MRGDKTVFSFRPPAEYDSHCSITQNVGREGKIEGGNGIECNVRCVNHWQRMTQDVRRMHAMAMAETTDDDVCFLNHFVGFLVALNRISSFPPHLTFLSFIEFFYSD